MECTLKSGELISLEGGEVGLVLRCTHGRIWLTKQDGQDYLIRSGRSFNLSTGESALIEALETTGLIVREDKPANAPGVLHLAAC